MDKLVAKFTNLLRYVPYIKEEKATMQHFLNFLPFPHKERIEFDNPKRIDEVVGKERLCYQQFKSKGEN